MTPPPFRANLRENKGGSKTPQLSDRSKTQNYVIFSAQKARRRREKILISENIDFLVHAHFLIIPHSDGIHYMFSIGGWLGNLERSIIDFLWYMNNRIIDFFLYMKYRYFGENHILVKINIKYLQNNISRF